MTDRSKFFVCVAVAVTLGACAATEAAKERSVFLREGATKSSYAGDLTACDEYRKEKGASEGEQGAAAAVGLILGGLVGAASAGSSYEKSNKRLFEECMFSRGYRLVTLPRGFGTDPRTEDGDFDRRKAALDLINSNRADELIAWENARNFGNPERVRAYLATYPNGFFAAEAHKNLAAGGSSAGGTDRK